MKKNRTNIKLAAKYYLVEIMPLVLSIAIIILCIMKKHIIKAYYDSFMSIINDGLRQWTIQPGDLLK
jgi:putative effector of murein hydrolase